MGEEFTVMVETGQLLQAAEDLQSRVSRLEGAFSEMSRIVGRTQNYWLGEAGEAHRNAFLSRQDKRIEAVLRLAEHVTDLRKMAGVYEEAERGAVEMARSLPGDVII